MKRYCYHYRHQQSSSIKEEGTSIHFRRDTQCPVTDTQRTCTAPRPERKSRKLEENLEEGGECASVSGISVPSRGKCLAWKEPRRRPGCLCIGRAISLKFCASARVEICRGDPGAKDRSTWPRPRLFFNLDSRNSSVSNSTYLLLSPLEGLDE